MKCALCMLLVTALLPSVANSACNDFCNIVGVYFDEGGECNSAYLTTYDAVPAYLIFTRMTSSTVNAWECNLRFAGVALVSLQPRGDNVTISPWPGDYMCGLAHPQPVVDGLYVAADLLIIPAAPFNNGAIYGDGVRFHLLPAKVPCYTDAANDAYGLQFGRVNSVLAVINDDHYPCVVSQEAQTFGSVKSLFR